VKHEFFDRALGCLLGAGIGSEIGSIICPHTENWDYETLRRKFGDLRDYVEQNEATIISKMGKEINDDTTCAILTAHALIKSGKKIGPDFVAGLWLKHQRIVDQTRVWLVEFKDQNGRIISVGAHDQFGTSNPLYRKNLHRFNLNVIRYLAPQRDRTIRIGFIVGDEPLVDEELEAFTWASSQPGFEVTRIVARIDGHFDELDRGPTVLDGFDVLWFHYAREPVLPDALSARSVCDAVLKHVQSGGGLFLGLYGSLLLRNLGYVQAIRSAGRSKTTGAPFFATTGPHAIFEGIVADPKQDLKGAADPGLNVGDLFITAYENEESRSVEIAEEDIVAREFTILGGARALWTAESFALHNFSTGIMPPRSHVTPRFAFMGGAIRAYPIGIVCCGNPVEAAELACLDASVTHFDQGVHGAQFVAACVAEAMISSEMLKVIRSGIDVLPNECETRRRAEDTLSICKAHQSIDEVRGEIISTQSNFWDTAECIAFVVASLYFGKGDLLQSICHAVSFDRDADAQGTMVGAISGAMMGAKQIPERWGRPVQKMRTFLKGLENVDQVDIARQLCELIAA